METLIGTSGWSYDHWNGRFYPSDVRGQKRLGYFAQFFRTVEGNSSFHRLPSKTMYAAWYKLTPPDFVFTIKMNREVTHTHKLKLDEETKVRIRLLLSAAQALREKLAVVLVQLQPAFRKNAERLDEFLDYLGRRIARYKFQPRVAVEFRNDTWLDPEIFDLLERRRAMFVISIASTFSHEMRLTTDETYIRFHGPGEMFASRYTERQLLEWKTAIEEFAKKAKRAYIYFNNDANAHAVDNARFLIERFGASPKKSATDRSSAHLLNR